MTKIHINQPTHDKHLVNTPDGPMWADTPETGSYIAPPNPQEAPMLIDAQWEADDARDARFEPGPYYNPLPGYTDPEPSLESVIAVACAAVVLAGAAIWALHYWGWLL